MNEQTIHTNKLKHMQHVKSINYVIYGGKDQSDRLNSLDKQIEWL